jgi:RHS repeat-associated protein
VFTDANGNLVEERRYEPFGVPIDARIRSGDTYATGAPDVLARDLIPLGKRTDAATGWSDHGARWMAPETGRWTSIDPPVEGPDAKLMATPWGLHPYQYVDQNPIAYWDPDGREPVPSVPYLHGNATPNGASAGIGMLNGDLGAGGNAQVLRLDGGNGTWTDASGNVNHGVAVQADIAKFAIAPSTHGPVGIDVGVGNAEAVCYANATDAAIGVEANWIDGAVTIGDSANYLRLGLAFGGGVEGRAHFGDSNHDGLPEAGLGADFLFIEADFRMDMPHAVAAANVETFVGWGLGKTVLPPVLQNMLPPLAPSDLKFSKLLPGNQ